MRYWTVILTKGTEQRGWGTDKASKETGNVAKIHCRMMEQGRVDGQVTHTWGQHAGKDDGSLQHAVFENLANEKKKLQNVQTTRRKCTEISLRAWDHEKLSKDTKHTNPL